MKRICICRRTVRRQGEPRRPVKHGTIGTPDKQLELASISSAQKVPLTSACLSTQHCKQH